MSADCCGQGATFEGLSADYKRRLWLVIAINASMFFVEMAAGALADHRHFKRMRSISWATRQRMASALPSSERQFKYARVLRF
jgi:hypothetical protein